MAQTSALLAYLEHPCLMPAGFQRSSATEQQPKRQRATEQLTLVHRYPHCSSLHLEFILLSDTVGSGPPLSGLAASGHPFFSDGWLATVGNSGKIYGWRNDQGLPDYQGTGRPDA